MSASELRPEDRDIRKTESLSIYGRLRELDENGLPMVGKKTVRSLPNLVATFHCDFLITHLNTIAMLLHTEKQVWHVLVTCLREERGPVITDLELEEVEEELKEDVTGEIATLTDIQRAVAGQTFSYPRMRVLLGLPRGSRMTLESRVKMIEKEIQTLEMTKMMLIQEDAEERQNAAKKES